MDGIAIIVGYLVWPSLVAWLVGYKFKPEISNLLSRFKGGQLGPHRLELTEQQQPVPKSITEDAPATPSALPAPTVTDPQVQLILDNLQRDFGDDVGEKLKFLAAWLLATNVEKQNEIRYRLIFGSQISALEHLNTVISSPASQLHPYFETSRSSLIQYNVPITFEGWLNFLVTAELVTAHDGIVTITPQGRDFLTYLAKNGMTKSKPH